MHGAVARENVNGLEVQNLQSLRRMCLGIARISGVFATMTSDLSYKNVSSFPTYGKALYVHTVSSLLTI